VRPGWVCDFDGATAGRARAVTRGVRAGRLLPVSYRGLVGGGGEGKGQKRKTGDIGGRRLGLVERASTVQGASGSSAGVEDASGAGEGAGGVEAEEFAFELGFEVGFVHGVGRDWEDGLGPADGGASEGGGL